jgi:lipopolysaccharide/colanic/teichoic acid biosynthesis glycosyltransferase
MLTKPIIESLIILALIPIILPIFLLVAIIILITMGRPIFYTQPRVGLKGRIFKIYKFRSMIKSSEKTGRQFAQNNDMRITKFGRIIRKLRIDEIPQLFNVLKLEMSIIGPRPEQEVFVQEYSKKVPLYNIRHIVRPGISGWAQVNQGYTNTSDDTKIKLLYDLYYIKYYSPLLDLKIIGKTIKTILTGFGAK